MTFFPPSNCFGAFVRIHLPGMGGLPLGSVSHVFTPCSLIVHLKIRRCESLCCVLFLQDVPGYSQFFSLEFISSDGTVRFHPKKSLLEFPLAPSPTCGWGSGVESL